MKKSQDFSKNSSKSETYQADIIVEKVSVGNFEYCQANKVAFWRRQPDSNYGNVLS